jgi:hypothetical protein
MRTEDEKLVESHRIMYLQDSYLVVHGIYVGLYVTITVESRFDYYI